MSKGEAIKAKGDELIKKFMEQPIYAAGIQLKRNNPEFRMDYKSAKQCSIIEVEEILSLPSIKTGNGSFLPVTSEDHDVYHEVLNYLKSNR